MNEWINYNIYIVDYRVFGWAGYYPLRQLRVVSRSEPLPLTICCRVLLYGLSPRTL